MQTNSEKLQKYFLITTLLIVIIGITMVFSASYISSKENFGSSTYFVFKQLTFLVIGLGAAFFLRASKMSFWYKYIFYLNGLASFFLLLTLTPLGKTIKGSRRWIDFGAFSFQPGEVAKYTIGLCAIYFFNNYRKYILKDRFILSLHFIVPLLFLVLQPDFGTFSISALLIAFACFISDFPRKYFFGFLTLGVAGSAAILISAPYRVKRLLTFMDPWADPQGSGFQIIQSYLAFAKGHIFGQGVGNSTEKLFYLPEAHNDFIFSVIGEELGFMGVCFIILLFISFTYFGLRLALQSKSKINTQIICLLVFSISIQAFLNMGVVLGLLPTKGLNLPLISYGGTSLVVNLAVIGLILSSLSDKSQIGVVASDEESTFQDHQPMGSGI